MKYRKKPVVINAFQITDDNQTWPDWFREAFFKGPEEAGHVVLRDNNYQVKTLEGWHEIGATDFVIQGVMGEIYACKQNIFHMTYEPVED